MGYRANAVVANLMAQLRASKTPKFQAVLGLVSAPGKKEGVEGTHSFREWMKGCKLRAEQIGYGLDEFPLNLPEVTPSRLLKILESRNIRGLIVAGVMEHGTLATEFSGLWKQFACVVVGNQTTRPRLHFACNDQYSTAYNSVREVLRLGYTKPSLVINRKTDELLDYRFDAGFWGAVHGFPQNRRIPPFDFSNGSQKNFSAWFQKHKPDVIITLHETVREWLAGMKLNVPDDVGLAHLDRTTGTADWAGMNQNNDLVGMAAVDMLVGQLHRNEFGAPAYAKCMLVESTWADGPTLGPQPS
jgi:DNA-binding LacI/PurR family transcriptional regulator